MALVVDLFAITSKDCGYLHWAKYDIFVHTSEKAYFSYSLRIDGIFIEFQKNLGRGPQN